MLLRAPRATSGRWLPAPQDTLLLFWADAEGKSGARAQAPQKQFRFIIKKGAKEIIRVNRLNAIGLQSSGGKVGKIERHNHRCASCDRVFTDTASGAKADRPGLKDALSYLRKGDTLVVWKLDRLGRSLKNLIEVTQELEKRGIGLRSLQEQIDTTTPGGKLVFHVFGALAEFERDLVRERTNAGLVGLALITFASALAFAPASANGATNHGK